MSDSPESPPLPEPRSRRAKSSGQMPASVRYTRGLLWLQGVIWGGLAGVSAISLAAGMARALAGRRPGDTAAIVVLLVVLGLACGFAVMKIRLARRVARGGRRTKKMVIVVETAMTCLGALMTAGISPSGGLPADMVALAAMGGAGLSLAAVLALLSRRARDYFAATGSAADPGGSEPPAGPGSTFLGPGVAKRAIGAPLRAWPLTLPRPIAFVGMAERLFGVRVLAVRAGD